MIISGGVNIYPQEAENALITHDAVIDVAVFGVPNEEFGEEVKAVVQPRDMADATPELAIELMDYCRVQLVTREVPALRRLPGRAAATPDRQALQATAERRVLGESRRLSRPVSLTQQVCGRVLVGEQAAVRIPVDFAAELRPIVLEPDVEAPQPGCQRSRYRPVRPERAAASRWSE